MVLVAKDLLPSEYFLRDTKAASLFRTILVVIRTLIDYLQLLKLYCNEIKKSSPKMQLFPVKRITKNVQGTERVQSCIE